MRFTRIVCSQILKVRLDDGTVFAIIGCVRELLEREVISLDNTSGDNTSGDLDKWLGIEKKGSVIREFDSLVDAKNYYRSLLV